VAKELHVLLTNAGISPPYVLVGHSLGGKNVRMFALEHPDEVAGMVLVDARSEYVDDRLSSSEKSMQTRAANLQAWGFGVARRIGLARIAGASLRDPSLAARRDSEDHCPPGDRPKLEKYRNRRVHGALNERRHAS
jgi:pimeloyl-ACP methyl ester carboxylesterase